MNKAEDKKQGDGGRFKGTTFQDLLDQETVEVPEFLRLQSNPPLGDEDLSVDRYISQEFFDLEKDRMWSKVWQMVCREEDIAEPGDHHVYNIIDNSVIITRTPSHSIRGYINSCLHRGRCLRDESGTELNSAAPFTAQLGTLMASFKAYLASGTLITLLIATWPFPK